MSPLTDADRRFLEQRALRRTFGLYALPALLVSLVLAWSAFYLWLPLSINPLHALGYYEGRLVERGTLTTYAMMSALLMNVLFALLAATLVLSIVWARRERRYLKLLQGDRAQPDKPEG